MTRAATQLDTTASTERADAMPAAPSAEPRAEALADLIASIGDEARRDPQGYLGRTVVPEGGE